MKQQQSKGCFNCLFFKEHPEEDLIKVCTNLKLEQYCINKINELKKQLFDPPIETFYCNYWREDV